MEEKSPTQKTPFEIHVLIYTATCYVILKPIIEVLKKRGESVTATVLADYNAEYLRELRKENFKCFNDLNYLNQIFLDHSRNYPRLLLLVADHKEEAHRIGYTAVEKARRIGIPSLSIQHGFILTDPSQTQVVGYKFTADKFAVWGEWYKKLLVEKSGIDPDRIIITGNPQFDIFPTINPKKSREEVYSYFKISPTKKICLLAMAASIYGNKPELIREWPHAKVIRFLSNIFKSVKDAGAELIVRPHPAEYAWNSVGWYKEAATEAQLPIILNNPLDTKAPDLAEILSSVNVTITQQSTVGLQSVLLGTPAISVATPGFFEKQNFCMKPYFDNQAYYLVEAPLRKLQSNLVKVLKKVINLKLSRNRIEPFINKFAYRLDGKASERVAKLINNMIREKFSEGNG
jgi:hypothetical protein